MIQSIGKGLLDVFKQIQDDRNVTQDNHSPVIVKDEADGSNPENEVAKANVIVANKLSAVTTLKSYNDALSLLNQVRQTIMQPQVFGNLENYYHFDRRSIGDTLLS
jgi:hypothetical protein